MGFPGWSKVLLNSFLFCVLAFNGMAGDTLFSASGEIITILDDEPWETIDYSEAEREYLSSEVSKSSFDEETYRKSYQDIYDAFEQPEEKEPEEIDWDDPDIETDTDTSSDSWDWNGLGIPVSVLRVVLIIIVVALLAFLLLRVFAGSIFLKNSKVEESKFSLMEELEEDLPNSDLERLLQKALGQHSYKLAIRIYYLMIIQTLSDKELINWKKDKTNNVYLREMREHESYNAFRGVTRQFERVWYGDMEVSELDYNQLAPRFQEYLNKVKL